MDRRITSFHAVARASAQAQPAARRYFIYLSWLPTYFLEVHGLNLRNSSALAFIPWLVMAIGSSVSGILADRWLASGASVATVRKTFQSIAFAVSPLAPRKHPPICCSRPASALALYGREKVLYRVCVFDVCS